MVWSADAFVMEVARCRTTGVTSPAAMAWRLRFSKILQRLALKPHTVTAVNRLSLVLSLLVVAGLSHADLRSEINASRMKIEKAAKAKDIKGAEAAYRACVTSDFKYVQGKQTQDFKTFLGNFTASIEMTDKVTSSSSRILSLKQSGNKATGEIEQKMTGTMKGADKKIHSIRWTGVFTEEYRKVGGKWKTAKMTAGPQKFLMDGKPVKM
jgi:hypothetical protein